MNTKRLITASIFSLISASTALAADVMIPHQSASSTSSTIVAPTFSWTGLYLGVQAGGFSSKGDIALVDQEKSFPLDKEFSPKLSGFAGGFYMGSNIDLGDNFIFGVDTDLMLSGKKHTKTINIGATNDSTVENAVARSRRSVRALRSGASGTGTVPGESGEAKAPESAGATSGTSATLSASVTPVAAASTTTSASTVTTVSRSGASTTPTTSSSSGAISPSVQSSPELSARSDTGGTSSLLLGRSASVDNLSGVGASGTSVPIQPAPVKPDDVAKPAAQPTTAVSSASSTESAVNKLATTAPTSIQPGSQSSTAEKTVPSKTLTLARSSSSSEPAKAANGTGTSGAQGYHGAHGGGYPHSHGSYHAGSHHGSGANPHGSHGSHPHGVQSTQAADKGASGVYGIEQMKRMASELGLDQEDDVETLNHTFKQNWGGATRVRIGFAADRFMPYLAGGIAYGQFQDTVSISVKDEDGNVVSSRNLTDETKTMVGYTLGGGIDFAMLDNVIVRAEYRYSDFGKKKFAKEKLEVNYKTNDFRVGVAYKF
ncbi:outer membrane protein [Bartonella massiliensis]|uniref:outer membrane protein n=1 Tax=Bartonella massiliensis TaxID=929795 RepID=UPI0011595F2E|nr:outer membrane protein [Bartonella massiliensis]